MDNWKIFCQFEHTVVGILRLCNLFTFWRLRFLYRRAFGVSNLVTRVLSIGPKRSKEWFQRGRDRFEVRTVWQWEFWVLCSDTFEVSSVCFSCLRNVAGFGNWRFGISGFGVYKNAVVMLWWCGGVRVNVSWCRISYVLALCRALGWLVGGWKP